MEECLKILDESIRVSVRASVKVCVNALEKDSFQREKVDKVAHFPGHRPG
jgi:hypothetical protein